MAEWDRLEERLTDLGESASSSVHDPLDPAVVRQRGARRRHWRWTVTVVTAAIMMISGGAGVYALTVQRQTPVPAGLPTRSPSVQYVESAVEPSGRASLLPTTSAPRERSRSVPLPYATTKPSTPDPGSVSPTPTPTPTPEPTDTPTPTPTLTPEPSPTSEPSEESPSYTALPIPSNGASR